MGNHQGKNKGEETLDMGRLVPFGVYQSAAQDFDVKAVKKLILERKIAPYYKGLNDVTEIDTLLSSPAPYPLKLKSTSNDSGSSTTSTTAAPTSTVSHQRSSSGSTGRARGLKLHPSKKDRDSFADKVHALYKDPLECPICFLVYPRNINYSTCCDEPICTECLIQIKSNEGCSGPPSCPYCAHENFSVLYCNFENPIFAIEETPTTTATNESRPTLHKKATPVAIDSIRPEHLRSQSAIETSRMAPINPARFLSLRPPRRNRGGNTEYEDYLMAMQSMGVDLEELMMMEAIRVSLQEAEERERSQANSSSAPDIILAGDGARPITSEPTHDLTISESVSGSIGGSISADPTDGEVPSPLPDSPAPPTDSSCLPLSDDKPTGSSDSPSSPDHRSCEI